GGVVRLVAGTPCAWPKGAIEIRPILTIHDYRLPYRSYGTDLPTQLAGLGTARRCTSGAHRRRWDAACRQRHTGARSASSSFHKSSGDQTCGRQSFMSSRRATLSSSSLTRSSSRQLPITRGRSADQPKGECINRKPSGIQFNRSKQRRLMKIAIPVVKQCLKCGSERTVICSRSGLEWLLVLVTRLRKYRCLDCGRSFRAADRRRRP